MKIFAYNLCLTFEASHQSSNKVDSILSFPDLMGHLFKGIHSKAHVFYLEGKNEESFLNELFDLQTHDIWRNMEMTVCSVFSSEREKEKFLEKFIELFKSSEAAGGLVMNEAGEYLGIFNRGRWSLPKGGVELRETIEDGAIREVQEETGVKDLKIVEKLASSFHTFRRRRNWLLKTTHWYKMEASSKEKLIPQAKEKILAVEWKSKEEWLSKEIETYPLIREVFERELGEVTEV